jgi:excisionase family DNA binding protein
MTEFEIPELLTPAEVAQLFRVDPKTVTRWANAGRIHSVRTLGGHRRYYKAEIEAHLVESHVGNDGSQVDGGAGAAKSLMSAGERPALTTWEASPGE